MVGKQNGLDVAKLHLGRTAKLQFVNLHSALHRKSVG